MDRELSLNESLVQALIDILESDLELDSSVGGIRADARLREDLGMDSVRMIEFIGAIEARFDIEFEEDDLRAQAFESLQTVADIVARRRRSGGAGA